MSTSSVRLSPDDLAQMRGHVLDSLPWEACGILGGVGGEVRRVIPVANAALNPTRFRMEPQAQVQAMLELEASDLDLVAIYHSHPEGPQTPSATDLEEAAYPEAAYLIWSPVAGEWTCSAFRLGPEGYSPVEIELTSEATPGADTGSPTQIPNPAPDGPTTE